MSADSWAETHPVDDLEPLHAILYGDSESDGEDEFSYPGYDGRRRKAALVLACVWGGVFLLNWVSWGIWLVAAVAIPLGVHLLRLTFARPTTTLPPLSLERAAADPDSLPRVSVVVAAKNEEAVVERLVTMLCNLDYPAERYEVCVVDDGSSDRTPELLDELAARYDNLNVLHRAPGAGGGKSGALNCALNVVNGDIVAIFDADARVDRDLLYNVVPAFERASVGAVQLRKAILNSDENFWTRGQAAEMAFDAFAQQQRTAVAGVGELRGNGQFVRRAALDRCGGFNEETITDDLDMSLRLHLDRWDVVCLSSPAVGEEGVTRFEDLWHQRSRWAEGGYQRYLDYWRLLARNRMGARKTFDALVFFTIQYLLPAVSLPDVLAGALRRQPPVFLPVTALTFSLSLFWMFRGIVRSHRARGDISLGLALWQSARGMLYFLHWFMVMISTTTRVSVRPKRLKWVKTVHRGE